MKTDIGKIVGIENDQPVKPFGMFSKNMNSSQETPIMANQCHIVYNCKKNS